MISSYKDRMVISPLIHFYQRLVKPRGKGGLAMHLGGAYSIVLKLLLLLLLYQKNNRKHYIYKEDFHLVALNA